jgi:hypothetical protein
MTTTLVTDYLGRGLAAARPTSVAIAANALALYEATDTGVLSLWNGTIWIAIGSTAAINLWAAAQRGVVGALTDATSIVSDFATANNFSVTLAGNRTLANPANVVAGQAGQIVITQDATGSRTLAYASDWKFSGGVTPVLSTAANAVDVLSYYVLDTTHIATSFAAHFS